MNRYAELCQRHQQEVNALPIGFAFGNRQFDGYCFYKENTNRYTRKSRLEERIDEARREVEADG